ncbi:hypothetical protein BS47DRAFT_1360437 [Hydnum rufescens UP504]|uniref:Uncharacterized protein n=1 Tax=Hydnum rufescens UP504 TaxID=1448309 RepID=A0A9P6B207_9AGAM|nr:hypothetical protein BS47DRAFT_1360437 [Hydnum rufescens UP504]
MARVQQGSEQPVVLCLSGSHHLVPEVVIHLGHHPTPHCPTLPPVSMPMPTQSSCNTPSNQSLQSNLPRVDSQVSKCLTSKLKSATACTKVRSKAGEKDPTASKFAVHGVTSRRDKSTLKSALPSLEHTKDCGVDVKDSQMFWGDDYIMANAMLGIESSGSDADADWDPAISTGGKDLKPSPVCSVAKKAPPGPHGHGGRFSQAQLDEVEKHAQLFWGAMANLANGRSSEEALTTKCLEFISTPTKEVEEDPLWSWKRRCNHDLSTEKASNTARIAMSGGDVAHQMALSQSKIDSEGQALHQIGVHLVYLMVLDLTSSTAAHGQNLINFNSEELRAWVDHEWNSCDTAEMKKPLASLYTYILEQKGVAEDLVKCRKDQDEATCTKETKDQYTLWKAVSADLLRMLYLGDDDILVTGMNNVPLLTVWQAEGL